MKKKFIIALSLLYLAGTGCKKGLDLRPTDTVTEEAAFSTVASLQKGLNTAYARYAAGRVSTINANSITSDEVKFGPDNGGTSQFGYRLQYTSDRSSAEVLVMFENCYATIDMVSRVLSAMETITPADAIEGAQRNYIRGQLLALRAMSHFELLENYANRYNPADPLGVPVILERCLGCQPARKSIGEVIAQVETDLNDAKASMPPVIAATYNDLALNQVSVTAYQARVALYKREWQRAADFATTVIATGIKPLVTGAAFSGIWTDVNTNEILFRSRFENNAALGTNWTQTNGSVIFSPSDKLTASYSASDIRGPIYIGTVGGKRVVRKFYQSSRGGSIVDLKGIRIAEMYLIRAEARAELNDLAGAAADINTLRTQRITGYTNITYSDKALALDDIIQERYKELAFEGFRFFDLKRRNLNLQRAASDVDSPLWQTLAAGNFRFVYPIPAQELLANEAMVQNPGY